MLGTAFPAARLLLVEQAGPWGREGLAHSHFNPTVAQQLTDRFDHHGVRILLIRRPGRAGDQQLRKWALADCRLGREHLVWGTFRRDADLLGLPLDVPGPTSASPTVPDSPTDPAEPVFLVCTHGSHDACCALRGRPVAAALSELRPDQVWECSHVGGDRFAANVLVLPSGTLYGSVHPSEAAELVEATERGEVFAGPLRGKVGLIPEAQAALAHAQQQWGCQAAGFGIISVVKINPALTKVRIQQRTGARVRTAEISVRIQRAPVHRLTCQMTIPATVFSYRPESMVEL